MDTYDSLIERLEGLETLDALETLQLQGNMLQDLQAKDLAKEPGSCRAPSARARERGRPYLGNPVSTGGYV